METMKRMMAMKMVSMAVMPRRSRCVRRVAGGALVLAALALAARAHADDAPPPNVVFILADDLGWTDLGCQGSGYYRTPHVDGLAKAGLRCTDAYAMPNCAPTRASLLTGRYPPRHGVWTVGSGARGREEHRRLVPPANETRLDPAEVTIAEVLRERGYATAHIGKWHLGTGEHGPEAQGFDVNVGGNASGHPRSYHSPYRNPQLEDGPPGEYLTDRLTEEAVGFIDEHADEPFYLHLAYYTVHTPIQPRRDLAEAWAGRETAGGHDDPSYAAMVDALDRGVGRVLAALEARDLAKRTLVVFTSDNGGVGGYREAGVLGARDLTDNAPLRGGKGMLYEGGVRVPLIVRWPGVVEADRVSDVPLHCVDWLPTLAEVSGATLPRGVTLDGVSFAALLRGESAAVVEHDEDGESERALFWHFPGYLQADARRGTWRTTPASAVRRGRWKLVEFFETERRELYDLGGDPGEERDLSASEPERLEALRAELDAWRGRLRAPLPTSDS